MGVISITQRRESLGNIGGTSAAHGVTNTNIGQVHHAVAQTFAPRYFRTNSHAGDAALAEGLGRLGGAMTRIGAAIVQRDEDRKVDEYANAMMDNMEKMSRDDRDITDWNAPGRKHLEGQKKGFYLRTGEGTKTVVDEWDKAFGDTFRKIGDSIGANDRVRERTMERLANYRRSTVSRLADHQASEYRRMELDAAKGNLATQRMIWKNGRTEVLPDIFAQQDRLDALNLATPETRKANREALAVQLAADFVDNSLQQCASGEDFDKVEEAVKGGLKDRLPDMIADNLPGGSRTLDGEYRKALLGEVKKAKRLFLAEKKLAERETLEAARNAAREQEIKLHLQPVPQTDEAQAAHFEQMGAAYAEMAKDPNLDEVTRLSYAKTAESLGFRAVGERAASAAARKAAAKEAEREANAQLKEAREQMFSMAENDFSAGGYFDDKGDWRDIDANEMAKRARNLLNEGKITRVQFNRLMTVQKPQMDRENLAFRDLVLDDVKKLLPNVAYRGGRFEFKPSAKVPAESKSTGVGFETGSRWWWFNPRAEYTYGQMIRAMNQTLDWRREKKASVEDAKRHFDELTKGVVNGQRQANVDAALEEERRSVLDLRIMDERFGR